MAKIIKFNKDYESAVKGKQVLTLLTELESHYSKIAKALSNVKRLDNEDKMHAVLYFQTNILKKIDPNLKIDFIESYSTNHLIKETSNVED